MREENLYLYKVESPFGNGEDFSDRDWFRARFAVNGLTEAQARQDLPKLLDELAARPYLRNVQVWWDGEKQQLLAEFELQSSNLEYATNGADNIFLDCASLTLDNSDDDELMVESVVVQLIEDKN